MREDDDDGAMMGEVMTGVGDGDERQVSSRLMGVATVGLGTMDAIVGGVVLVVVVVVVFVVVFVIDDEKGDDKICCCCC